MADRQLPQLDGFLRGFRFGHQQLFEQLRHGEVRVLMSPELWDRIRSFESRSTQLNGRVKRIVVERGFGFIAAEDGKEYFFHRSSMAEGTSFGEVREGDAVTFEPGNAPKGPRAESVRLGATVENVARYLASPSSTPLVGTGAFSCTARPLLNKQTCCSSRRLYGAAGRP